MTRIEKDLLMTAKAKSLQKEGHPVGLCQARGAQYRAPLRVYVEREDTGMVDVYHLVNKRWGKFFLTREDFRERYVIHTEPKSLPSAQ